MNHLVRLINRWLERNSLPKTGMKAIRETDTLILFLSHLGIISDIVMLGLTNRFEKDDINYWLPVDQYIGVELNMPFYIYYIRDFLPKY